MRSDHQHESHPLPSLPLPLPDLHQQCIRINCANGALLRPSSRTANNQVLIRTFSTAHPSRIPRTSPSRCLLPASNKTSPSKTMEVPAFCGSNKSKSSSCNSYISSNNRYFSSRFALAPSNLIFPHQDYIDGNTEWNSTSRTIRSGVQPQSD